MHYDELANIIRDRREVLKITQEHLAELSGIGLRTLKSIETGNGNPTLDTIIKIIEILGLELKLDIKSIDV
ncbi:MAG: helix-turn-helix transcriptional regulator [Candidatus Delongbacteria bacterium]|nr:helix-turn-helix transcriptional regulator [Candidatus Delongbacteria bacterium]